MTRIDSPFPAVLLSTLGLLVFPWLALGQEIPGITPPGGAAATLLKDGFGFTEGPAAHPDGSVYFTDLPSETIHVWTPDGQVKQLRDKTGRANGLAFDASGRLVACEMNHGRLTATGSDGVAAVLVSMFQGKPFNQTNDLVMDPLGGIYFSDPYYGPERSLPQDRMAVYYLKPGTDMAERVVDKGPAKPNGVLLSPDAKTLYVIDSENPTVWCFQIGEGGALSPAGDMGKFTDLKLPEGKTSGGDGGAVDSKGNLYITSELGIQVIAADGKHLGIIAIPQQPANCAFFGPELKSLFVTARTAIYKVDLLVPGLRLPLAKPAEGPSTSQNGD
ncbi:MAG: SMP-30/gluconolactonase/LRE family protein [Planctomycetota bacterium]